MPFKPHPTDPDKMVFVRHQYDLPTKRTWVGLKDDDEIPWDGVDAKSFAKAIEAKLKEKNYDIPN